jgi:hypothetical protein
MPERKTSACSDKCRAAKSRRRRVPLPAAEARAIRESLNAALEVVWEAKATLERRQNAWTLKRPPVRRGRVSNGR